MIILLDTSTSECRLTVVEGERMTAHNWDAGRELSKGLLRFLQDKTGDLHQITGIGVMRGPGSFTGLRIGLTVANTLADSLDVPVVGETGENWQQTALTRLRSGANDQLVLPLYGSDAHITQPRK